MIADGANIGFARRRLAQVLREAGCDSPDLDARLLVGHALGLDHAALVSAAQRVLTTDEIAAITALARRRLAREPVARIVGVKEFWGLPLRLSPATLVPRPDTETLVEAALEHGATETAQKRLRIADLGTGSGAILLALLSEWPAAFGVGTDMDEEALRTARRNARALGLSERAHFVACDFGAALAGGFDLVISNPPYIPRSAIAGLAPEVRDYDPPAALDGGLDGLQAYRVLSADAQRLLAPGGMLALELGAGQADAVSHLLSEAGLAPAPPRHDLAGIARAICARKPRR